MYFDAHNRVKITIGLARGKKLYDKRADMAKRDSDREIQRALKERSRY
jgi:SsrA-binding protein